MAAVALHLRQYPEAQQERAEQRGLHRRPLPRRAVDRVVGQVGEDRPQRHQADGHDQADARPARGQPAVGKEEKAQDKGHQQSKGLHDLQRQIPQWLYARQCRIDGRLGQPETEQGNGDGHGQPFVAPLPGDEYGRHEEDGREPDFQQNDVAGIVGGGQADGGQQLRLDRVQLLVDVHGRSGGGDGG